MTGSYGKRLCQIHLTTSALGVASIVIILAAAPAQAQSFLESLMNALGARGASVSAPVRAGAIDSSASDFIDRPTAQSGPKVSYCVRLCDGRFFPLPRSAGVTHMSSAKICSAMCATAETRVYSGSAIERAVGESGERYSALKTAFLFREKVVDHCTCTGGGSGGVVTLDIKDDPTLRRGDIVVTREGPMVFTGDKRTENRASALVPVGEYKGLPQHVRHELAGIQIAADPNDRSLLPVGATPATAPAAAQSITYTSRGSIRIAPTQIAPVAEAFATFRR
jgi:hypothetical protein